VLARPQWLWVGQVRARTALAIEVDAHVDEALLEGFGRAALQLEVAHHDQGVAPELVAERHAQAERLYLLGQLV